MPVITIDRLAFGGAGFGRIGGKACFVPYTAPGELVDIAIVRDKRSYSEGVLQHITVPSISRIEPRCKYFTRCGGCDWQHIDYEEQCRQKELIFADTLWRTARIEAAKIRPLLPASEPFFYRQRVQLKSCCRNNVSRVGFYSSGTHNVVDIADGCSIADKAVNNAIGEVKRLIHGSKEPENVTQVDLFASQDGYVSAVFYYAGVNMSRFEQQLQAAGNSLCCIGAISVKAGKKGPSRLLFGSEVLTYNLPSSDGKDLIIRYDSDGFSQVNFAQNRVIVAAVLDFCAQIKTEVILDLYCGNGNFSLPLAGRAIRVAGFESGSNSVRLANINAVANNINNAVYHCMDSAAALERLAGEGAVFDLAIIDPPRSGAADVTAKLFMSKASHVIYISCDAPTLARDLNILQKNGYEVIHTQPVDMFPQTYHLESITFLRAVS